MKIIITTGIFCLGFLNQLQGQIASGIQGSANTAKFHHISLSIETEFPVQHLVRMSYSIESVRKPIEISFFIQGGLSGYFNQSIDFLVDKKEKANTYLKNNMQSMPGIGAGTELSYRHWNIEFLYQNTGYTIKDKKARELVENLLPEKASYIAEDMNTFSNVFPMFGNIYNNYLLTPKARLHQLSSNIGYKFLFWKNSRLGSEFKLGVLTIIESTLNTSTQQSNEAADYLVGLVNSSLDEELRQDTQWLIMPTASIGIFIKL